MFDIRLRTYLPCEGVIKDQVYWSQESQIIYIKNAGHICIINF
jgi:hypothetical protein